jgi:hypothetical protein
MDEEPLMSTGQDLEAYFLTTMIKQESTCTSEASWQVMMFGSANNTWK